MVTNVIIKTIIFPLLNGCFIIANPIIASCFMHIK